MPQVEMLNFYSSMFFNRYSGRAVFMDEDRAQHFLPVNQLIETLLQRISIQGASKSHRARNVICRALRLHLIEEPQTFLRKRKRKRILARDASKRMCCQSPSRLS